MHERPQQRAPKRPQRHPPPRTPQEREASGILTSDKHLARWARAFSDGKISTAPPHGWQRFLRDGWSRGYDQWHRRYRLYIRSHAWQQRRAGALSRAGHQCVLCQATKHLHVHHVTYRNVGLERMEDLRVVCAPCHRTIHATPRPLPVPMDKATLRLVAARYERQQERQQEKADRHALMDELAGTRHAEEAPKIRRRPKADGDPSIAERRRQKGGVTLVPPTPQLPPPPEG